MATREANNERTAGGGIRHPPVAERRPTVAAHHGIARADDYAWLRADNWQQVMRDPDQLAPDIRAYLEAENAYAATAMADAEDLRRALYAEMRGRIKEDDSTVPAPDGPYAYATQYLHGAEHPQVVRTGRDGGDERVLLDADAMAAGKAYFHLGGASHSRDHRFLAYSVDEAGNEFFTIRVRDTSANLDLADVVPESTGAVVWSAGGESFYYVWVDSNHRPARVLRHIIGTDPATDELIFEDRHPGFFLSVAETQSRRFLLIDSHDHETSEVRVIDLESRDRAPRLVAARTHAQQYHVQHRADLLYILTNADDAEDFKIVATPLATPEREYWRDFVPHAPGRLILDFTVYENFLVRLEREASLPRIVVRDLTTGGEHAIAFDEEAYSLGLVEGYEFDTATLRFTYSSMKTPSRVFDYDIATRQRTMLKEQEIPSGHDPDAYETRRVFAPGKDGEPVPVSLLYRKGMPLNGSAPLLLYGYGAYGMAIPAAFSVARFSLVDRGFVYAIAHVRGGKDRGYRWYAEGRRERKINTFTDFIACGEFLADRGFTRRGRIVAWGGSAGGLLMGAVANMAPSLFAGVIAEVPFVDTLTTMLDATLPLTPPEWPEWGNPIESAADYRLIASYSPYDNVRAQAYPAILVLAGLSDPRVTYWEPAKWVAKLRANKTDRNLIVFRTNMDAGHGGASGRFDRLHETAFAMAFALKAVGKAGAAATESGAGG